MPTSPKPKDPGPLALSALKLEQDFNEVERLSVALNETTEGAEVNFEHAQKLLTKFSEAGLRVGEEIQALAKALSEGHDRAERATQAVAKAADLVKKHQEVKASISERFQTLAGRVQGISTSLAPQGRNTVMTAEDKTVLRNRLPELEQQLETLVQEALKIREEAHSVRFKELESNADKMTQHLQTTCRKIKAFAESATTES